MGLFFYWDKARNRGRMGAVCGGSRACCRMEGRMRGEGTRMALEVVRVVGGIRDRARGRGEIPSSSRGQDWFDVCWLFFCVHRHSGISWV